MTTPIPLELGLEMREVLDEMVRVVGGAAISCAHPLSAAGDAEVKQSTRRAREAPRAVARRLGLDETVVRQELNWIRLRHGLRSYLDLCWCHAPTGELEH